jgi:defect in organelle trafficking protein DotD
MKPTPLKTSIPLAALAVATLMLAGCATPPAEKPVDPAAKSVDQAIERAKVELPQFTATAAGKPQAVKDSGAVLSMDYAGEAKVLLSRLAAANNLQFRVLGPQPHLPLFVIVNVRDAEFVSVLRDIGEQFGGRADLVLNNKAIEVHYRDR